MTTPSGMKKTKTQQASENSANWQWNTRILELKRKEHDETNPPVKTVIERQIGAEDRQIDEAVYRLYNLSEEEISVIEGEKDNDKHN
jgi:hypothetical protein